MKRFLLFAGENYYPLGGAKDFEDLFDTLVEAKTCAAALKTRQGEYLEWANILDIQTKKVWARDYRDSKEGVWE